MRNLLPIYHITGRQGQNSAKPTDQAKLRRVAEREGRRGRRRKHREREKKGSQPDTHHEGQSTDDEETEVDAIKFRAETSKQRIISISKNNYYSFLFHLLQCILEVFVESQN